MPWQEVSTMSLRQEFVMLSLQPGVNMARLCRDFGVARKTGYKWRARYEPARIASRQDVDRSRLSCREIHGATTWNLTRKARSKRVSVVLHHVT